jgi:hypothetical protein
VEKLDFIVIGNEPGGLWLLERLAVSTPTSRLGWISTTSCVQRIPVSSPAALEFGLGSADAWSIEVVTPRRRFFWNEGNNPAPNTLTSGIWKRLGRSRSVPRDLREIHAEFSKMQWWQPEVRSSIPARHLSSIEGLRSIELEKDGLMRIVFADADPWQAKRVVICLSAWELRDLALRTDVAQWIDLSFDDSEGLFPLELTVQKHFVPTCLSPVTVLFDSETIPDSVEIWPVDFDCHNNTLTVWISTSLRALDERRLKQALARLSRHFPFLPLGMLSSSVLLDCGDCAHERTRILQAHKLRSGFIPLFPQSRLHDHQTRLKPLSWIAPDHYCHLPYPAGPLRVARRLWQEYVGKKRTLVAPQEKHA